jgi:hypothetical protein
VVYAIELLTPLVAEEDLGAMLPSRHPVDIVPSNAAQSMLTLCSTPDCPPALLPSDRVHTCNAYSGVATTVMSLWEFISKCLCNFCCYGGYFARMLQQTLDLQQLNYRMSCTVWQ